MLHGARVLVTGGAGFLGANLVRRLLAEGADVLTVLRPSTDTWRLRDVMPQVRILCADIRELPARLDALDGTDIVFHLASAAVDQRVRDVDAMFDANVYGTYAVLQAAERLRVRRVIHMGSSGEYGPATAAREDQAPAPNAEYGATKAAGTLLVQAFGLRTGLPVVTLRPFSVFGPFEGSYRLVPYCVRRALDNRPVELTSGSQTRDYVFVGDVMNACLAAAVRPEAVGAIFNVCTGVSTSVRDMVLRIVSACGSRVAPLFGARPDNPAEMWRTSGNPERARQALGWHAETSLDDGVARTIEWFRREAPKYRDVYTD